MSAAAQTTYSGLRERVRRLVEHPRFVNFITVLILVNAAMLGLETSKPVMAHVGSLLHAEREAMHLTTREMSAEVTELRAEVRELLRRLPPKRDSSASH